MLSTKFVIVQVIIGALKKLRIPMLAWWVNHAFHMERIIATNAKNIDRKAWKTLKKKKAHIDVLIHVVASAKIIFLA